MVRISAEEERQRWQNIQAILPNTNNPQSHTDGFIIKGRKRQTEDSTPDSPNMKSQRLNEVLLLLLTLSRLLRGRKTFRRLPYVMLPYLLLLCGTITILTPSDSRILTFPSKRISLLVINPFSLSRPLLLRGETRLRKSWRRRSRSRWMPIMKSQDAEGTLERRGEVGGEDGRSEGQG
ncbi:unnamed protein product [Vicia faba]|uniref:Uncharacterized protein n=1 Tax=Vicia faba TaxID=3906 RepID=A0AAV0ZP59_VICFA|nr:unnamed protein product [Vicia faba]